MKIYENGFTMQDVLKAKIKEEVQKFKVEISRNDFQLGVTYLINELNDFSKDCVIGLSEMETFIFRQAFGFNEENITFSYKEIKEQVGKQNISWIVSRCIYIFGNVICDMQTILKRKEEGERFHIYIGKLGFSTRTLNILRRHHIYTLGDLVLLSEKELFSYRNMGNLQIQEIKKILHSYELSLSSGLTVQKDTTSSLKKKREEKVSLQKLALDYQKISLQMERLMIEKNKIEEKMQAYLSSNDKGEKQI